jgi:hypothetical protein
VIRGGDKVFRPKKVKDLPMFEGSLEITPRQGSYGFYDKIKLQAATPFDLLDMLVIETKKMVDKARERLVVGQESLLSADLFLYASYYSISYGRDYYTMGSGSSTTIDSAVQTVANMRRSNLSMAFSDANYNLHSKGKPSPSEYDKRHDATDTHSIYVATEDQLAYEVRFFASAYMEKMNAAFDEER